MCDPVHYATSLITIVAEVYWGKESKDFSVFIISYMCYCPRGGGGGVLTTHFGRYVPRQSEKWQGLRNGLPVERENDGLRNELEPFWRENANFRNGREPEPAALLNSKRSG